jgi:hypothetical protein
MRGVDEYRRVTDENMWREEKLMLDFVLHCTVDRKWAPSTLKLRLAAIRHKHLSAGLGDPFEKLPRVYMALDGYKKRYGKDSRRRPVTIRMLKWIRERIDPVESADDAAAWLALLLGFFFLLRASEYVKGDRSTKDTGKGLRGCDLVARCKGEPAETFRGADEVVLKIRGSKTDQYNQGEIRNHFRTTDPRLCVIQALADYESHQASRMRGPGAQGHLLVWGSGGPVQRSELQVLLERAAVAQGVDPRYIGSHSLRFGGASALWAAFRDSALVRRWGRWASDAFHGYLWEDRGNAKGVAEAMRQADVVGM